MNVALNGADFKAIESFVRKHVIGRNAYGPSMEEVTIQGESCKVRFTKPRYGTVTPEFGLTDIKGDYSPREGEILFRSLGYRVGKSDHACEHCGGVIAHEAIHALQQRMLSPKDFESGLQAANNRKEEARDYPERYADYVSSALELPAHAAMIAFSMREHDPSAFDSAALKCTFYYYFENRLDGSDRKELILSDILAEAKRQHSIATA
ncbi:hypothetical protein [uncultured Tateyamaria sp.]|uniref:hypothetical protein n=1 Tax=uncultured Tateyamaria sp. TaxID=455651 RepID=UPI0026383BA1|nr:hypothetical protein [uncultured Tateyamaria sp.]